MTPYLEFSIEMLDNDDSLSFSLFCCFNSIFNDIYHLLSTETRIVYRRLIGLCVFCSDAFSKKGELRRIRRRKTS